MTELLNKAVEAVRRLAPDAQDDIACIMLHLVRREEEPEGIARADRRELASDAEVEAAFRRFG